MEKKILEMLNKVYELCNNKFAKISFRELFGTSTDVTSVRKYLVENNIIGGGKRNGYIWREGMSVPNELMAASVGEYHKQRMKRLAEEAMEVKLEKFSDEELVAELRNRGLTVKVSKMVKIEL